MFSKNLTWTIRRDEGARHVFFVHERMSKIASIGACLPQLQLRRLVGMAVEARISNTGKVQVVRLLFERIMNQLLLIVLTWSSSSKKRKLQRL